jgi:hypothetical protein
MSRNTKLPQVKAEIRPGDIYRDRRGECITIKAVSDLRVSFVRNGYVGECICSPDRLHREFTRVIPETFNEWRELNSPLEKIQKLKALINARRGKA